MAKGDVTQKDLLKRNDILLEKLTVIGDKTQAEVEALRTATATFNSQKSEPFWKKMLISLSCHGKSDIKRRLRRPVLVKPTSSKERGDNG